MHILLLYSLLSCDHNYVFRNGKYVLCCLIERLIDVDCIFTLSLYFDYVRDFQVFFHGKRFIVSFEF